MNRLCFTINNQIKLLKYNNFNVISSKFSILRFMTNMMQNEQFECKSLSVSGILPIYPSYVKQRNFSSNADCTALTESQFHTIADASLEEIYEALSILESDSDIDMESNYSQGVLKIDVKGKGSWVINKQTPNRQIWWSSPISGPRRYQYYKRDKTSPQNFTNSSQWIYTRDNTILIDALKQEILMMTGHQL